MNPGGPTIDPETSMVLDPESTKSGPTGLVVQAGLLTPSILFTTTLMRHGTDDQVVRSWVPSLGEAAVGWYGGPVVQAFKAPATLITNKNERRLRMLPV